MKTETLPKPFDRRILKIIAVTVMFIGHFLIYTIKELKCFGLPAQWGRLLLACAYFAPPVFMFFVAEGFRYTHSRRKYGIRLLIFALVTQIAFSILNDYRLPDALLHWNVIMLLFFGFLNLCILESGQKLPVKLLLTAGLFAVSYFLDFEWRVTGQLVIIAFYLLRNKPLWNYAVFAALMLFDFAVFCGGLPSTPRAWEMFGFEMLSATVLLFFYNGKKGRSTLFSKYFFYVFYPAHLLLIKLVKCLLTG